VTNSTVNSGKESAISRNVPAPKAVIERDATGAEWTQSDIMAPANKTDDKQSRSPGDDEFDDAGHASRNALTRQDIALAIHGRVTGVSRREAKRLVDCVIDEMVATLISGESLKLHDFGSFLVREKHERSGRNPRTGAPVPIEARRVVVFKASPNMKATVNGESAPPHVSMRRKRATAGKVEMTAARQKPDTAAMTDTAAE